jgi:hypothetical protein
LIPYLGDYPTGATVYVPFHTFAGATGASITLTGLAVTDIEIYKDGSTTQRASDAGYTLLDTDGIDFDGLTGLHGFSVALSDNTDAGFYAAGHEYMVAVSSVTVDGQTVNFWAGTFSIERVGGVLELVKAGTAKVDVTKISGDATAADNAEAFFDGTGYAGSNNVIPTVTTLTGHTAQTGDAYAIVNNGTYGNSALNTLLGTIAGYIDTEIAAILAAVDTEVAAILADTNELQTDWTNGGRLDLLIDAIKAKTDNLPAAPAAVSDIPTAAAISDAVWDEATAGHAGAGSTGKALTDANNGTSLDAAGIRTAVGLATANLDTQLAAIVEDTGTTLPATLGSPAGASMSADIAAVKTDTAATRTDAAKARKLIGNKMEITDATGAVVLYDDDNVTPIDVGTPTVTDDSTTTTRTKVL